MLFTKSQKNNESFKMSLKSWVASRAWPSKKNRLLLSAILSEPQIAVESWRQWKLENNFDEIEWEENKLLAHFSSQIKLIEADCHLRPRIQGLTKIHWTRSQMTFQSSSAAIRSLSSEGIEVMLLKGAAIMAKAPSRLGPRITTDLDILVKRCDFERSISILYDAGWETLSDSMEGARLRWRFDSGVNLRLGLHGDIDVHHQPFKGYLVREEILEALWSRASPYTFYECEVLIPSIEDLVVITSIHATQFTKERSAAWVIDLVRIFDEGIVSPKKVLEIAHQLNAITEVFSTLLFIQLYRKNELILETLALLRITKIHWRAWLNLYIKSLKLHHQIYLRLNRHFNTSEPMAYKSEVLPKIRSYYFLSHRKNNIEDAELSRLDVIHEVKLPALKKNIRTLVMEIGFKSLATKEYRFDVIKEDGGVIRISIPAWQNRRKGIKHYKVKLDLPSGHQKLTIKSVTRDEVFDPTKKNIRTPFNITKVSHD
jgi:hypothetical protein